jgi:ParB/RepB/Spo0J family partition protein
MTDSNAMSKDCVDGEKLPPASGDFDPAGDDIENATTTRPELQKAEVVRIPINDVVVRGGRRPIDDDVVASLKQSMSTIGMKTPITVRMIKRGIEPDGPFVTDYELVTGAHRLAVAKQLGWKEINVFLQNGDDTDARLWEIAENLHRKELNGLQRAANITEWLELAKKRGGQVDHKPSGGRPEGGIAEAARVLPLPGKTEEARRKTIERSLKINKIDPEAKAAATAAGLADNQQALLAIAREPTKDAQLTKVAELASRKRAKREQSHPAKGTAPTIVPPAGPPASATFRTTKEDAKALSKHAAGSIGQYIDPYDLIIAPGSKSANARQSEYALIRIPSSHHDRKKLKQTVIDLGGAYNTEVFFKVLPQEPHDQGDEARDDDVGVGRD